MTYHASTRRVCAVCGYVLDEQDGRWIHGIATADLPDVADHPVIPVRDDEVPAGHIRTQCDFCVADDPQYILPVRDFVNDDNLTGSTGDWAICGDCAEMVTRNDWNGLYRRALAGFQARHKLSMTGVEQAALRSMYRKLRKNVTGSIYPVQEATS